MTEETVTYKVPYGLAGPDQVQIEVTGPVMTCTSCDFEFTDYRGEEAADKAVSAFLASRNLN